MTLVASLLFLSALLISVLAISRTMRHAMPRIVEIIEMELEPIVLKQRKITFGVVRIQQRRTADIVKLRRSVSEDHELKIAA